MGPVIIRFSCRNCGRTVDDIPAEKPSCIKCHIPYTRTRLELCRQNIALPLDKLNKTL